MRRVKSALTALAVGIVLLTALDYVAAAATGNPMILGLLNKANKPTVVKNTAGGPAMSFVTGADNTPFLVNSTGKVAKLNADLLDGKNSAALGVRTTIYTKAFNVSAASNFGFTPSAVPAGRYLATMNGWIYGPASGDLECYMEVPSTSRFIEDWIDAGPDGFYTPGTAGVINVPVTQDLIVLCQGTSGDWSTFDGQPLQISLTRIDQHSSITPASARVTHLYRGAAARP